MPEPVAERELPPVITSEPQLSLRAIVTGAAIGGVLALANIYTTLKIGWTFNMSITSALLAFGLWSLLAWIRATRRPFTMLENNLQQTGASAAASISSSGLGSAVPALTMLDGHAWSYGELAVWVLCCSMLGVFVAILFRRRMLIEERLRFPNGIATAETLKEMYARGREAAVRVTALVVAGAVAAAWKVGVVAAGIRAWPFPGPNMPLSAEGAAARAGVASVPIGKLGFALDPSLIMVGAGVIVGVRICTWMFIGSFIAWVGIGSYVIDQGWVVVREPGQVSAVGPWLLWPGVTLLVTSSLASLLYALPQFAIALGLGRLLPEWLRGRARTRAEARPEDRAHDVPPVWLWSGVALTTVATLVAGHAFFGMHPLTGLFAVGLTSLLAIVALRVTGETNITPIGPMGKVTQLAFGAIDPGNVSTNLMAANITGGSASQASDMMFDLKTGLLLGSSPRAQAVSQMVGVVVGALVGSAIYLLLMESIGPKLTTPEWQAPAVQQWKAVAVLFRDGFDKMPPGALDAMVWAGVVGVLLTLLERSLPARLRKWAPSATAIGIAFIVSAAISLSFFLGGVAGWALARWSKAWFVRFGIVVAAGLIAGESLSGMVIALVDALTGR